VPIDLGAHRWNLPLFLLDALVAVDDAARRSLPQTARAIAMLSWTPLGAACALELSRHTLVLN
jgi:hypothetical protein